MSFSFLPWCSSFSTFLVHTKGAAPVACPTFSRCCATLLACPVSRIQCACASAGSYACFPATLMQLFCCPCMTACCGLCMDAWDFKGDHHVPASPTCGACGHRQMRQRTRNLSCPGVAACQSCASFPFCVSCSCPCSFSLCGFPWARRHCCRRVQKPVQAQKNRPHPSHSGSWGDTGRPTKRSAAPRLASTAPATRLCLRVAQPAALATCLRKSAANILTALPDRTFSNTTCLWSAAATHSLT